MRIGLLSALVFLTAGGPALADGLAYHLPPDRTWVKYRTTVERCDIWNVRPDDKKGWVLEKEKAPTAEELAEASYFQVRSVGREAVPLGRTRR
jgi:hypothetical protein